MIGFVTVVNIRSTLTETGNAGSSTHVANEFFQMIFHDWILIIYK